MLLPILKVQRTRRTGQHCQDCNDSVAAPVLPQDRSGSERLNAGVLALGCGLRLNLFDQTSRTPTAQVHRASRPVGP